MNKELHRHDISDNGGKKIKPHTIGERGTRGRNAKNTRQFINGVFWILCTGALWQDLPSKYGHWKNVHRRFCRWRNKGMWENILATLIDDADFERLDCCFIFRISRKSINSFALMANDRPEIFAKLPLIRALFTFIIEKLRARLVMSCEVTRGGSTQRSICPWMLMVC